MWRWLPGQSIKFHGAVIKACDISAKLNESMAPDLVRLLCGGLTCRGRSINKFPSFGLYIHRYGNELPCRINSLSPANFKPGRVGGQNRDETGQRSSPASL